VALSMRRGASDPIDFLRGELWHYLRDVGMNKLWRREEEEFQGSPWQGDGA
jgi:hypothetical protein